MARLFFSLSGFLITRLLLDDRAVTIRIDFRTFRLLRVLRLHPTLAAASLGVWVLGLAVGDRVCRVPCVLSALYRDANWCAYSGHSGLVSGAHWTFRWRRTTWPGTPARLLFSQTGGPRTGGAVVLVVLVLVLSLPRPTMEAVRGSYPRCIPIV